MTTLKFEPWYYKNIKAFGPDAYKVLMEYDPPTKYPEEIAEISYMGTEKGWMCSYIAHRPHTESTFTQIAAKLKELNDIHKRIISQ